MSKQLDNFIFFPRSIASDRLNGILTKAEYETYMWIRINSNPYGISTISMESLCHDLSGRKKLEKNYINQLLLSLKSKRYVYYKNRAGYRGSFEVHIGDIPLPGGGIKNLDNYFNHEVRALPTPNTPSDSEVTKNLGDNSQSIEDIKSEIATMLSIKKEDAEVRGCNNDNDNNNYNNTNRRIASLKKDISPSRFTPNTYEEEKCKEIAIDIGEKTMDFLLATSHTHGFHVIERAYGEYNDLKKKNNIQNPPAYFNSIIKRLIEHKPEF